MPEAFRKVEEVVGVVVTYERFPLVNSPLGRQFVRDIIKSKESFEDDIEWSALSLDELEFLEPYLGQKNSLSSLTDPDAGFQDHLTNLAETYNGIDTEFLLRSAGQEVLTGYLKYPEGRAFDGAAPHMSPAVQSPIRLSRCPLRLTPFRTSDDGTKEHIIPEALWNESYELHFTCGDCNHFMAHSFENAVTRSKFIQTVQEMFCPPAGAPAHRRTLQTAAGEQLHMYVDGDSLELRMPPQLKETTREISIEVLDAEGKTHRVPLTVPFELPSQIAASPHYGEKTTRRAQKRLGEYIEKLWEDLALNPEFARYLNDNGIELDTSHLPKVPVSINQVDTVPFEEMGVPDIVEELPLEEALRFFGKIAFLHTCQQLGPEVLDNPVGEDLRVYLLEGEVPPDVVRWLEQIDSLLEEWIRHPTINDQQRLLWDERPERIRAAIDNQNPPLPVDLRDALDRACARRINRRRQVRRYFIFPPQVGLDESLRSRRRELAFHSIEFVGLRDLVDGDLPSNPTGCRIKLFGGLFEVVVQVSNAPLHFGPEHSIRIEFDERVPQP